MQGEHDVWNTTEVHRAIRRRTERGHPSPNHHHRWPRTNACSGSHIRSPPLKPPERL